MNPVFIDFHIHTSSDPNNLNSTYDLELLNSKIEGIADGAEFLISLTDHNTINKPVYLKAVEIFKHIMLGVELHVRNYPDAEPYHCHILFNLDKISDSAIDDINSKLDELYPNKEIKNENQSIPRIEAIMDIFDDYEFLLLPHGGQNHKTFDGSIPDGKVFDKTLERSIYYNYFDGFTARSNKGLEKTHRYFERLGIKEFVNLVTTSDNYKPQIYPDCKAGDTASEFTPTWMLASPTFNGLRLSLSEASRLKYGEKPDLWAEFIQRVSLKNEHIDIDVELTPGLNVIIGGSSSGKSLFVDSVVRKIVGDFKGCVYLDTQYSVENIEIINPAKQEPHYLNQNYISTVCNPKDNDNNIDDISILKKIFPSDTEEMHSISNSLAELKIQLSILIQSIKEIEQVHDELKKLPVLSSLMLTEQILRNPLKPLIPNDSTIAPIEYTNPQHDSDTSALDKIDTFLTNNPLVDHDKELVQKLKEELGLALKYAAIEKSVRELIAKQQKEIDADQKNVSLESTTKRQQFEELLRCTRKYLWQENAFYSSLKVISEFRTEIKTKKVISMGHSLFIDNEFALTKEKFLEVVNHMLKKEAKLSSFEDISPESLFQKNFSKRAPKVSDYDHFMNSINSKFAEMNKKKYRIITRDGDDFYNLSAGWKTSVILDLILGWDEDNAPLIIDQPEDNLATSYINFGLLNAIKACKTKKQIILVSHNATIPMLGDAQNIVVCKNQQNHITIRSAPLEGSIDDINVMDAIAKITDGGKISVKKRVKKYNLKNFRGDNETNI